MAKFVLALFASAPLVSGHAALYSPVPRNSNDRDLPQFAGGKSPKCPCTCDNGLGTKGGPWPNNKPCGQGGHNVRRALPATRWPPHCST